LALHRLAFHQPPSSLLVAQLGSKFLLEVHS
jgi:hypothetical protein